MPGKYTDGYTKSAQKKKFIRNRDIKLKDSELRKEAKIFKLMCEGICNKCRDIVQWKFRYDKYKPLKAPGNCQQCRQKKVTKAYRTLCDSCASKSGVCPSCVQKLTELNTTAAVPDDLTSPDGTNSGPTKMKKSISGKESESEEEDEDEMDNEDVGDDMDESEDSEEAEETVGLGNDASLIPTDASKASEGVQTENFHFMDTVWNEKKFMNVAASKYSKSRVVGKDA